MVYIKVQRSYQKVSYIWTDINLQNYFRKIKFSVFDINQNNEKIVLKDNNKKIDYIDNSKTVAMKGIR